MQNSPLYERDFFAWANEPAALLRSGKLDSADIDHIAEEIESMGRTEKRELVSRLAVLLTHLLKWRFQPSRRGVSWRLAIEGQRRELSRHMADNPSLKSRLGEAIDDAYGDAVLAAARQSRIDRQAFPPACPWSYRQISDPEFWPNDA
jgi:hypothetical protein